MFYEPFYRVELIGDQEVLDRIVHFSDSKSAFAFADGVSYVNDVLEPYQIIYCEPYLPYNLGENILNSMFDLYEQDGYEEEVESRSSETNDLYNLLLESGAINRLTNRLNTSIIEWLREENISLQNYQAVSIWESENGEWRNP